MQFEYFRAKNLLDRYGINSIESRYVENVKDAQDFFSGNPVVLKVISDKALHKTKAGLVRVNLSSREEIGSAYLELERKAKKFAPYRIIIQRMAAGGIEIILGGREDPQFGKLVLIGLGGIYVEAFKDFALRVCPISRYDAREMIDQLISGKVITHNGRSEKMLEDLLLKVSDLLERNPQIKELDLNPVIIRENNYDVVDIRILG